MRRRQAVRPRTWLRGAGWAWALSALLVLLPACDDDHHHRDHWITSNPIYGSGNVVTESRSLPPFDGIDLQAVADVAVAVGGSQGVVIRTDDNLMGHIFTEVSGGVLRIGTDVDYETPHGVRIVVDVTAARHLQISGVGTIAASGIASGGGVRAVLSGVGTISLSGNTDSLDVASGGVGTVDAQGLLTRRSRIVTSSVGDCRVTATDELDVTITGPGNVYYAGDPPVIRKSITGTGMLIAM